VTPEVSRALLWHAARETRFPAVPIGQAVLCDEGAWRYAISKATPPERVALLVALGPDLLRVTPGGDHRLRAQTERALDVDDEPTFYGDAELLPIVRAGLALAPPVVRWAIQREVAWIAIATSRAWTGSTAFVDSTGRQKHRMVVLGPTVDIGTVLHEMAHVWCGPTVPLPNEERCPLITAQGGEALRALAAEQGWARRIDGHIGREEKLADSLALAWLYTEPESARRLRA